MMADPRIVENPRKIDVVTYRELRELAYMGATVLHEDSIFPVLEAAIPINVKNTNDPENSGTMIIRLSRTGRRAGRHHGIAGKRILPLLQLKRRNEYGDRLWPQRCHLPREIGLSFEHMPSSIDTISIVVADIRIRHCIEELIDEIHAVCQPDSVEVSPTWRS